MDSYRPLLKWAGGKRWLLPTIERIWRSHPGRRYVEPFSGGASIAFGLKPESAVLNDINPHLINFYRHVRRGLSLDIDLRYDEDLFYSHRERFNSIINNNGGSRSSEAAQLFYYLNRTGFNGLCRFNGSGLFNVPFGKYKDIEYQREFGPYRELFRRWELRSVDFEKLQLERGDFVYCDPPYFSGGRPTFDKYTPQGFSWEDQVRLTEWLARHRGPVLLSNQASSKITQLYRRLGFSLRFLSGPRRINANGIRVDVREVLASRNL